VYGSPTYGPWDKCWFDYGDSNPNFESGAPWLHVAVAAVSDARALGLADGQQDVPVVEAPAVELLSVTSPTFVNKIADQVSKDHVAWSRAVIELDGGRYATLRYNIDEAFEALVKGGVDLTPMIQSAAASEDDDVPQGDVEALLTKYFKSHNP
jgi:hypothetical protein